MMTTPVSACLLHLLHIGNHIFFEGHGRLIDQRLDSESAL
jgi:hypothetical protein